MKRILNTYCMGLPFWIGTADKMSGRIMETHSYKEAETVDFHTDFYFSEEELRLESEGKRYFFWTELSEDGEDFQILSDDEIPEDVLRTIRAQIFPVSVTRLFHDWRSGAQVI